MGERYFFLLDKGDILCQYPLHDRVNLFLVIVSLLVFQHHIDDTSAVNLLIFRLT